MVLKFSTCANPIAVKIPYLGFTKLAELSYNHEIAGKENHIDFIEGHYDELMKEVQRIVNFIMNRLQELQMRMG